jgi:hypothetical protein
MLWRYPTLNLILIWYRICADETRGLQTGMTTPVSLHFMHFVQIIHKTKRRIFLWSMEMHCWIPLSYRIREGEMALCGWPIHYRRAVCLSDGPLIAWVTSGHAFQRSKRQMSNCVLLCHVTRSWDSCICLTSSQPLFVRYSLMLCSHLLLGLPSGRILRGFPLKFYLNSLSPPILRPP